MRPALLAVVLCALSACSSFERIRTIDVLTPVSTSCVPPGLPEAPEYVDNDVALIAAPDLAERYRLLVVGRDQRTVRLDELETVVDLCRKDES